MQGWAILRLPEREHWRGNGAYEGICGVELLDFSYRPLRAMLWCELGFVCKMIDCSAHCGW